MENFNQDEASLNTNTGENDYHERDRLKVDVYHHFDKNTEELVSQLIKFLANPIEMKMLTSAGIPVKLIMEPQPPQTNQ